MWASEGFNRSATTANSGMLSPHEVFFGDRPPLPVLPFCKPAYHRVPRRNKMHPQARPCFPLNFGYNHGSDCFKIMLRGDGKGHALARRHMTSAAGTADFPGLDSRIGSTLSTIRCRNARLHIYPAATCRYWHACSLSCARSSYRRTGACISRHRTSTRTAIKLPSTNPGSRCSGTGAQGRRAHAWTHARRGASIEGLLSKHGPDVPCRVVTTIGNPRGF